ncbi:retrovirus-related pol polyprotein from transposon TNT 1-94 [Tanacetum coccineum]|uniref:Retrovirus-related pol polyprotein from transposon TNT 1-94 n=1 Tax=Tanacetum coccineum TaxID=301880 RepID=A0ABQ4ZCT7_9ASTR
MPRNIVKALGRKGRRKEKISSKEIVFTKADESSFVLAPEITFDLEYECDSQEPLPPLPKLIRVAPFGTSESLISLSDLTLNMADLTLYTHVPKKTRPPVKVSPTYVIKKKIEKSTAIPKPCSDKKVDSSTEQLLLTLIEEEIGPKVVFRDDSLGDTEGYGSVNCNRITFTRVAFVKGLKHNLINISQLCDANYKILFTKTQGTIYNQNDEVFLIAPRRRDVYIIDIKMENLNEVRVKELRSDNRIEFKNYKLEEFCDEKGISQNFSSFCIPEQNGVAERRNKTLIKAARTMINSAKLPKQFWGEAVNIACYTQNRSIIMKGHGKTSYDVFRGRSPDISYFHWLKLLGCSTSKCKKWKKKYMLHSVKMMKPFLNPAQKVMQSTSMKIDPFQIMNSLNQGVKLLSSLAILTEVILQTLVPQDRWSREKHIELVNIIGESLTGITTKSRIRDSDAASAFECLYVNFLSEMETKKLIEAIE